VQEFLYKRGYKTHIAQTPLRESIAAALVRHAMSAVWGEDKVMPPASAAQIAAAANKPDSSPTEGVVVPYTAYPIPVPRLIPVLWDPFCGAATLVLEALDANYRVWRALPRRFGFEAWPTHSPVRSLALHYALCRREGRERSVNILV
jgi:23S rRNA G2445 N2-methylase RlmL